MANLRREAIPNRQQAKKEERHRNNRQRHNIAQTLVFLSLPNR